MVQIKCLSNGLYSMKNYHIPFGMGFQLELITFEILAAERLRLMAFDNRLIIDCFANVVNILTWQFSTNDRFKSEKYESITWKFHFQK